MPVKNPKDAALDRYRSEAKYAHEQSEIWKRKAESEEMRSDALLAENQALKVKHAKTVERMGILFGQVQDRDEALIQLALRSSRDGDPSQIAAWRSGETTEGAKV